MFLLIKPIVFKIVAHVRNAVHCEMFRFISTKLDSADINKI